MSTLHPMYAWQWPDTGPTAVNYGLDTEIFDSEKFPHAQTLVREAIQNSLDARFNKSRPVRVRFAFFEAPVAERAAFLADLQVLKKTCELSWPEEWNAGQMTWLVVEDSNSSGLNGDLKSRTSDFWNYWLNFGISNKSGAGRGGRGIGRITFLIASGISTVIGVTRRAEDGTVAACGMSLLKPVMVEDEFKSSYAYLAKAPAGSIYALNDETDFLRGLVESFGIADYGSSEASGLSLIIPFPHHSLNRDRITAAAIEHFAPAIISGSLLLEVDGETVDHTSIDKRALAVADEFPPGPMREDPVRVLSLIRNSNRQADLIISVANPGSGLSGALDEQQRESLRALFYKNDHLCIAIDVPVTRKGKTTVSRLRAAVAQTPKGKKPADLFFREGMCLPEVDARNPADIDLIVQSNEGEIVSYLNFCEGKAHLGLIENKEVRAKLLENGFEGGYTLKRFVRHLMDDVRSLVLPDVSKPDATVFSGFFSLPKQDSSKSKGEGNSGPNQTKTNPKPPPPPPLPRQPNIFLVDELPDGFRVRANKDQTIWPANLRIEVAYADGSRNPSWSVHDFDLQKLAVSSSGSAGEASINRNVMLIRNCDADFQIEMRGFDPRRELVTSVKGFRNA